MKQNYFHQRQSSKSIFHAEKGGSEKAEKVGISAFSHPIRLTEAQVLKRSKCIQEKFKFHRTHHIPTLGERTIVGAAHIRLLSRPAHAYCTYVPAIKVQHTDKYMTMISHHPPPITWFPLIVRLSTSSKSGQVRRSWSVSLPPWLIHTYTNNDQFIYISFVKGAKMLVFTT